MEGQVESHVTDGAGTTTRIRVGVGMDGVSLRIERKSDTKAVVQPFPLHMTRAEARAAAHAILVFVGEEYAPGDDGFRLQPGERYWTRGGHYTGPLTRHGGGDFTGMLGGVQHRWNYDGRIPFGDRLMPGPHPIDLVRKYSPTEEPPRSE